MAGEHHPAAGEPAEQIHDAQDVGIPVIGDELEGRGAKGKARANPQKRQNRAGQERQRPIDPNQADNDQEHDDEKRLGFTKQVRRLDLGKSPGDLSGDIESQEQGHQHRVQPASPGHVNQHGKVHHLIGEGVDRLPLHGVQVALAGNLPVGDIGNHPEGKEEKTKPRIAHMQEDHGEKPHRISGPTDGVGMEQGVATDPCDLLGGSQQPDHDVALRSQHQQNRKRDLNQD